MKILVLADLHIGKSRESSTHPGIIRQANSNAYSSLEDLINRLNNSKFDLVVQMGDMVRDLSAESDEVNFNIGLNLISKLNIPTINILGNHDIHNLSRELIMKILSKYNFSKNLYSVLELKNFQIAWVDFDVNENSEIFLPEDSILFLENNINKNKNTILFSHYSLIDKKMTGNFLFAEKPEKTRYRNLDRIYEFLKRSNIKTVVSAHDHWGSMVVKNNVNYITLPSFSENSLVSSDPKICPAVYSIINVDNDNITIDSYSGDYSFFHLEFKI